MVAISQEQKLLPGFMLEATGHVLDQATDRVIPYNPNAIAPYLQGRMLDYFDRPPSSEDGYIRWLLVVASRQQGKSVTAALGTYNYIAYRPGTYGAIITDTKERARDLFRNISLNHRHVPEAYRSPDMKNNELNQLTFKHGGKIRTLSAEQSNVGIGRAMSFGHLSELPFMDDAAGMWNGLFPAIANKKFAPLIMESTPAQMSLPSAEWYRDMAIEAKNGSSRFDFLFVPFYSSKLNERTWNEDWTLEDDEIEMLARFGPKDGEPLSAPGDTRYLTVENLAFRRYVMANDREVRRWPDLFKVFYPTDSVTCWLQAGGAAIPSHALARHLSGVLVPWRPTNGYMEYQSPREGAIYVIGADPAGWMGGDQASFQVLEVWEDKWVQVAEFSSNEIIPADFARAIVEVAERYNNATVIVENNGVGQGTLAYLEKATHPEGTIMRDRWGEERRYHLKRLYYHKLASGVGSKPGIPANQWTNKKGMASLLDALMDRLVLYGEMTLNQLQSYGQDKEIEPTEKYQILNPGKKQKGRRAKHHWDRVSALIWACVAAETVPVRYRPRSLEEQEKEMEALKEKEKEGLTWNERQAIQRKEKRKARQIEKAKKKSRRARKLRRTKKTNR